MFAILRTGSSAKGQVVGVGEPLRMRKGECGREEEVGWQFYYYLGAQDPKLGRGSASRWGRARFPTLGGKLRAERSGPFWFARLNATVG